MFGASHFFNGVLSRRIPAMSVAVCSQIGGAVLLTGWAVFTRAGWSTGSDLGWAAASGLGAGIGVGALYAGMRACRISVVVPVTSIVSVAVPFLLSVLVLGDQVEPLLMVAAVVLIPATWLLSRPAATPHSRHAAAEHRPNAAAAAYGLLAGSGYATQLFALSRISAAEPGVPMLLGQLVSILVLAVLLAICSGRLAPSGEAVRLAKAAGVGGLAALAMIAYLYATREAALAPVMVAIALYPALPVLLALLVLKERLSRPQVIGLLIAALVLPLINIAY